MDADAARRACGRCGAILRAGNAEAVCDPCRRIIESCREFLEPAPDVPARAPQDVNLLELIAGLMLTHDALHPGEPLYLREALARHGVEVDGVRIQQAVAKLRRRHRLVLSGETRRPGYTLDEWTWTAYRVRNSVAAPVARFVALPADNG